MNIGVIGTGAISGFLLEQVNGREVECGKVVAVFGRNPKTGLPLSKRFGVPFDTDIEVFLSRPLDVVIEAAGVEAATQYALKVVESNKDLVVGSIGAFKDVEFLENLQKQAAKNKVEIHLPSGAIGGLDLLQSANAAGGLKSVQITTRKSPDSLGLGHIEREELLFDGNARDAIVEFPKNVNVAVVLALAGIGMEDTRVRVIADPAVKRNSHTIEAQGIFGEMRLAVDNEPMPSNPKTSLLAALSILAVLKARQGILQIGN